MRIGRSLIKRSVPLTKAPTFGKAVRITVQHDPQKLDEPSGFRTKAPIHELMYKVVDKLLDKGKQHGKLNPKKTGFYMISRYNHLQDNPHSQKYGNLPSTMEQRRNHVLTMDCVTTDNLNGMLDQATEHVQKYFGRQHAMQAVVKQTFPGAVNLKKYGELRDSLKREHQQKQRQQFKAEVARGQKIHVGTMTAFELKDLVIKDDLPHFRVKVSKDLTVPNYTGNVALNEFQRMDD